MPCCPNLPVHFPACLSRGRSEGGITQPLEVFRTRWKGWGVRCAADLQPGAFVATYEGEVVTSAEAVSTAAGSRRALRMAPARVLAGG